MPHYSHMLPTQKQCMEKMMYMYVEKWDIDYMVAGKYWFYGKVGIKKNIL